MDKLEANRMFLAVMETGSFTAAAARLGTSSGQASKLVSSLENALGVRLLNRTTRAIAATEAGQAYFERMRALLDEFDGLEATIRDAAQEPRGRLRLTAPLTFGALALTQALSDFALAYPQIELDVNLSDRMVNLVDEGFDMAIRGGAPMIPIWWRASCAIYGFWSWPRPHIWREAAPPLIPMSLTQWIASFRRICATPIIGAFAMRRVMPSTPRCRGGSVFPMRKPA